jgi:hypothetical protein
MDSLPCVAHARAVRTGNRSSTQRATEVHLRVHLKPHLGSVQLDQVRGLVMDRFFAKLAETKHRQGKRLSEKTRKNIRATLRKMLVCAVDWELLDAVPRMPRIKVPEPKFDFYTREESELLLGGCSERRGATADPLRAAHGGSRERAAGDRVGRPRLQPLSETIP